MPTYSSEVDGVQYVALPSHDTGCRKCAARVNGVLCNSLPDCEEGESIAWVKRTPETEWEHIAWLLETS